MAVPVTARLLRESAPVARRTFDLLGFVVVATGLVALLVGLQQGGSWGWSSGSVVLLLVVGGGLLTLFVIRAVSIESPLAEIRLFTNPVFALSLVVMSLSTLAQFARIVYIPLELQGLRGIPASTVGWLMMPSAVGMAITLPVGGKLVATFIVYLVVSTLIAYLTRVALPGAAPFAKVFQVAATAGILAYCFSFIPNALWFGAYKRTIAATIFDGIVFGLVIGAIFAWRWPHA